MKILQKNIGRTIPDVQYKEFSLITQKLDLELTMSESGITLAKKIRSKKIFKKIRKSKSKCRM